MSDLCVFRKAAVGWVAISGQAGPPGGVKIWTERGIQRQCVGRPMLPGSAATPRPRSAPSATAAQLETASEEPEASRPSTETTLPDGPSSSSDCPDNDGPSARRRVSDITGRMEAPLSSCDFAPSAAAPPTPPCRPRLRGRWRRRRQCSANQSAAQAMSLCVYVFQGVVSARSETRCFRGLAGTVAPAAFEAVPRILVIVLFFFFSGVELLFMFALRPCLLVVVDVLYPGHRVMKLGSPAGSGQGVRRRSWGRSGRFSEGDGGRTLSEHRHDRCARRLEPEAGRREAGWELAVAPVDGMSSQETTRCRAAAARLKHSAADEPDIASAVKEMRGEWPKRSAKTRRHSLRGDVDAESRMARSLERVWFGDSPGEDGCHRHVAE